MFLHKINQLRDSIFGEKRIYGSTPADITVFYEIHYLVIHTLHIQFTVEIRRVRLCFQTIYQPIDLRIRVFHRLYRIDRHLFLSIKN